MDDGTIHSNPQQVMILLPREKKMKSTITPTENMGQQSFDRWGSTSMWFFAAFGPELVAVRMGKRNENKGRRAKTASRSDPGNK